MPRTIFTHKIHYTRHTPQKLNAKQKFRTLTSLSATKFMRSVCEERRDNGKSIRSRNWTMNSVSSTPAKRSQWHNHRYGWGSMALSAQISHIVPLISLLQLKKWN